MMNTSGQDGNTPLTREGVPATDAVGRSQQVTVYARENNLVVLKVAPGEVAVLNTGEALALADRLYEQAGARPQPSATVVPFRRKSNPNRPRTGSGT